MIGLKNIRIKRKLNQQKVAMDLNISREALSYYENGKREPSLALLLAMSQYYNVSINYLITGEEFQKKWTYPFYEERVGSFLLCQMFSVFQAGNDSICKIIVRLKHGTALRRWVVCGRRNRGEFVRVDAHIEPFCGRARRAAPTWLQWDRRKMWKRGVVVPPPTVLQWICAGEICNYLQKERGNISG